MANTISRSGNSIRGRRPRTDVDMIDAIRSSWEDLPNDRLEVLPPPIPTPVLTTPPGIILVVDDDDDVDVDAFFNPRSRLPMGEAEDDDDVARDAAKAVKAAAALTASSIKLSAIFSGMVDTSALKTQSINAMCPLPG